MHLRDDTRGAAIQIGAVLLFATLILALSSYQAVVVPAQNGADEFDHSKQVQGDMQDVRNAILSSAGTGTPQSASVRLGTEFQNRMFFLNPPDPVGTLSVEPDGEIRIENAVGPDTNGYWNGSARSYETASIAYEPTYREYANAPTTRYEHSLVYNTHDDRALSSGDQRLFAGETLSIVSLTGERQRSHSGTESVDVVPHSAGAETVRLVADGDPIRLSIPTEAPDLWADRFDAEPRATVVETRERDVVVELDAEESGDPIVYELRAAAVGIGTGETRSAAAYAVREGPENTTVDRPIAAEIRDRYDTSVAGSPVSVYRDGERIEEVRSGRDGVARYYPEEPGEYELRIGEGEREYERVFFSVDRGSGDSQSGEEPGELAYRVDDLSNADTDRGRFVASFDADGADRVEATFEHESGWGSETIEHDGPRGHVRYERDGVYGDEFQLTLRAFATGDGEERVVATESLTVDADTENPAPDGVLRGADSPTFEAVTITDESAGQARYDIDHQLEDGPFDGHVEAVMTSNEDGGYDAETSRDPEDSQSLQTYGVDEEFKIAALLYDADGAVVDVRIVRDRADGEDPEV